jgi:hypothetical protein
MDNQNPQKNCTTNTTPHNGENTNIVNGPEKTQEEIRAELFEKCRDIANSQNILSLFSESIEKSGLAGNEKAIQLLYMALTSRLSYNPISVIIKGESSSGKSYTADKVVEYFSNDAVEIITSISDKALAYFDKPLKHRILYYREAAGLTKNAEYLLRSLISEKRIDHYTVGSNGNGPELRHLQIEGPAGALITTTKFLVHPENETRLLSIDIDTSLIHMKKVFLKQSEEFTNGAPLTQTNKDEIEKWKAFHSWIALGSHEVIIPYANAIFSNIPPIAARLFRDMNKLGELIKAHALIHQQNRKRTSDGKIIAELIDYEAIYSITADWFAIGVELAVSDKVRKVVEAVKSLSQQGASNIRQSDIRNLIEMEKTDVSRAVKVALEKGYLKDLGFKRRGCPSQLVISSVPMPENESLLPPPEKVKELFEQASGNDTNSDASNDEDQFIESCNSHDLAVAV